MRIILTASIALLVLLMNVSYSHPVRDSRETENTKLYRWLPDPKTEAQEMASAQSRLHNAINNPEYMLKNWVVLPTAPDIRTKNTLQLSLREAILLALRYNPNIQNAELDRIVQRYQLKLANNEFELQYALAGSANVKRSDFSGVGDATTKTFAVIPDLSLKTLMGTQMELRMNNNDASYSTFNPILNFSITQPLLRGFGKAVNEVSLLNAKDNEFLNKINLKQSIANQVTQVIKTYREMISNGNNLQNQRLQLKEAKHTYEVNEKKIEAGQLEPTGNIQQSYQIESLSLMVEQAENDFKTAGQNLLQTIGLDPFMQISVPSNIEVKKIIVPDLKKTIHLALEHNVEFQTLKLAYKADQRAYMLAKNEQLWELNLSGNVQAGKVADVDGTNKFLGIFKGTNVNQSASVTLKVPIRDLSRRSRLINAKIQLEKDRLKLIAARRSLITDVTNFINTIESQAKRYQLAQKQVKLAEKAYQLQKKRQDAGISSALDVNNTQNQLIQAQSGLISAKIAYLNQISSLQRLLGTTLNDWKIQLRYGE